MPLRGTDPIWALAAVGLLLLGSCGFVVDGPTKLVAQPDGNFRAVMIVDSPSAREALAREARWQRLDGNHITEKHRADWEAFMRTLDGSPVIELAKGTKLDELDRSDCRCSGWPTLMIKARVADGTYRGKEGWICESNLRHVTDAGPRWE